MKPKLFHKQKQSTAISAKMQQISRLLLTTQNRSPYACLAFAKSEAECGNSKKHTANNSTPLTRAFFIRCSRTPKERCFVACSSMVACSGQGLALDCVPYVVVFHPVARYRPTLWKMLAIAPFNLHTELSAMKQFAYSFLCVNRNADPHTYQEEVIRIIADSEENARFQLTADWRMVLPHAISRIALKPTACTAQTQVQGGFMRNSLNFNHCKIKNINIDQSEKKYEINVFVLHFGTRDNVDVKQYFNHSIAGNVAGLKAELSACEQEISHRAGNKKGGRKCVIQP